MGRTIRELMYLLYVQQSLYTCYDRNLQNDYINSFI